MDFHRSNEPSMGELLNFALSLRYELQDLKNLAKNHLESQKPVISKLPGPETSTEFYTSEQVKAKLKVKDRTLYNYHITGILRFKKMGGRRRYRKEDVEQLINQK